MHSANSTCHDKLYITALSFAYMPTLLDQSQQQSAFTFHKENV